MKPVSLQRAKGALSEIPYGVRYGVFTKQIWAEMWYRARIAGTMGAMY